MLIINADEYAYHYIDDLLVWGKDDEEHDARLQVLTRPRDVNLKFNAKKCKIKSTESPMPAMC